MMETRRRDLDSVKRYAEWRTSVENEGHAFLTRHPEINLAEGPVVELELGYRSASYFLHSPSHGSWEFLNA